MAKTFTAAISSWVAKSERRMEAVFKQSGTEVFELAQKVGPNHLDPGPHEGGRMPVIDGKLRASLVMSTLGNPAFSFGGEADSYVFAFAGASLGEAVTGVWTAVYARRVHYRSDRMWVPFAASHWQEIVARNCAIAQAIN